MWVLIEESNKQVGWQVKTLLLISLYLSLMLLSL